MAFEASMETTMMSEETSFPKSCNRCHISAITLSMEPLRFLSLPCVTMSEEGSLLGILEFDVLSRLSKCRISS